MPRSGSGRAVMAELPGVHRVRARLAGGVAEYWYAWRGGPKILAESAATPKALKLKVQRAEFEAGKLYHKHVENKGPNAEGFVAGLIYAWQESAEFALLSPRTQRDLKKHLSLIRDKFGTMAVAGMGSDFFRKEVMDWRGSYAATPRTADHLVSTIAQLMAWGKEAGRCKAEFGTWRRLYRVDRSAIVWEMHEVEAVCAKAAPELQRTILLAAYTGLRQGDLLRLTWADVGKDAITRVTAKRKRTVHVPRLPEVDAILDACPRVGPVVLTDRAGKPWNVNTLNKHFDQARKAAGITGKRWHDLRGTYATFLVRAGVPETDLAEIMGWSKEAAAQTKTSYVGGAAVAQATVERLRRFTANGQAVDSKGAEQ
jgi:integrase